MGNAYLLGATLSPAEAAEEVALLPAAFGGAGRASNVKEIARTDFARLRRGRLYLTDGLRNRARRQPRAAPSPQPSAPATGRRSWTSPGSSWRATGRHSRAHGPQHHLAEDRSDSEANTRRNRHRAHRVDRPERVGLGVASALHRLRRERGVRGAAVAEIAALAGLAAQGNRSFDVLRASKFSDGSPCDFFFDVSEMMAVVARHFPVTDSRSGKRLGRPASAKQRGQPRKRLAVRGSSTAPACLWR